MFFRYLLASLVCLSSLASQVLAEDTVLGKNREEWLKILKEHKESKFRRAAVIALSVFGAKSSGVLPGLLDALEKDGDAEIRREVALSLGIFGDDAKGTIDHLVEALVKDKDGSVREAAARSLGRLAKYAGPQVMQLGKALKDTHAPTRVAAAEALTHFENVGVLRAQLVEAARDAKMDRFTRIYVVRLLANLEEHKAQSADVFQSILEDGTNHPGLRKAAADGLGVLGEAGSATIEVLAKITADDKQDLELRRAALVAIGKVGTAAGAPWKAIAQTLKDSDAGLRYQAVRVTGLFGKGNKEASALLQARLKDQSVEVVIAAIQELGELSAADMIADLERLASSDPRRSVREAAATSLKKLKSMP